MPLGARDIMMVVRARDLASRTLRNVGTNLGVMGTKAGALADKMFGVSSAMTTVGLGIAAIGAVGVTWLDNSTDAAIKYNQTSAKTLTQVDQIGVKLEDVKRIGRDVARAIPAPFEEMQTALYDIFSSMDVNVRDAEVLLREFSRAAVAGQVDLQDASRATIGILNAYGLEAKDVNRINDVMFQLVRKGVGTYGEFAEKIGLSVPAAVRAGQSIETLAGMLAFLTRQGLAVPSATAAAGRALENLAHPTVIKRLEDMGVKVRDANGEFRPMVDVVGQLSEKMGKLTKPEQAKAIQDLLSGAGSTVQARRFWSLAIQNFDEFKQRVDEMGGSAGALDSAYAIMFEQPQSQIQLLKNQYEILRTEIGDELIPVKMRLAEIAMRVLDAWNGLSDGTQRTIIMVVAAASAFALIAGIALTVVGGLGMILAILMSLGASLGVAIAILGGFMAALVAIPAIIALIIIHFDTIKKVAGAVWGFIKDVASDVWQLFQQFWDWLSANGVRVWHAIGDAAASVWDGLVRAWDSVVNGIRTAINRLVSAFKTAWQWLDQNFGRGFRRLVSTVGEELGKVFGEIVETVQVFAERFGKAFAQLVQWFNNVRHAAAQVWAVISMGMTQAWSIAQPILQQMGNAFMLVFNIIQTVVMTALDIIVTVIGTKLEIIWALFQNFSDLIMPIVTGVWNQIVNIITFAVQVVSNIIQFVLNIIQGDWGEAWQNVKNILKAAWEAIGRAISEAVSTVIAIMTRLPGDIVGAIGDVLSLLYGKGRDIIQGLWRGAIEVKDSVVEWVRGLPSQMLRAIGNLARLLFDVGKQVIQGFFDGMKQAWEGPKDWLNRRANEILDLKGPPARDAVLLVGNGRLIMEGLHKGLLIGWRDVESTLQRMTTEMGGEFNVSGFAGQPPVSPRGPGADDRPPSAGILVEGDLVVREEAVTDDLDWWAKSRTAGV